MAKLGDLVAKIGANTKGFNEALGDVNKRTRKMSGNISNLGKKMSMSLTLPLAAIGATSAKTFMAFEQQMSKVKAVSGATADEFSRLEANAKQLGASTRFSASEVAQLQTEFAKLGFTADEITKVTGATLALAQATDSDLARAAEVAGATLRGFGLDASETERVTDVMASSFSSTALDMESFAESMKFVAPVSKAAGLSIEETTAMLGALANSGVKGSQAGTALRRIISELGGEGENVAEQIKKLSAEGLSLAGSQGEVGRSASTALLVLSEQMGMVGDLTGQFKESAGAAKDMAAIMDNTMAGSFARMRSAVEAAQISIGEVLAPAINKIANLIAFLSMKFSELSPGVKKMIVVFGGLVAAVGPLLFLLPQIVSIAPLVGAAFTAMTGPIGLVVAAVVGAVALIVSNWDSLSAYFTTGKGSEVMSSFQQSFSSIWLSVQELWRAGVDFLTMYWAVFGDNIVRQIQIPLELVLNVFDFAFKQISNVIMFWRKLFEGDFRGAFDEVKNIAATSINFIIDTYISLLKVVLNVADNIATAFGGEGFYDEAISGIEQFAEGLKLTEKEADKTADSIADVNDELKETKKIAGSFSMPSLSTGGSRGGKTASPIDAGGITFGLNNTAADQMQGFDQAFTDLLDFEMLEADNLIDPGLDEDLKRHGENMELFKEKANAVGSAVGNAFSQMGGKIVNSLGLADTGMEGFAKSMAGTVTELIAMLLSQSIATAITAGSNAGLSTGPAAPVTTPAFIATLVGGVLSAFAAIPAFAEGGLVSGPTMGLMGEYTGARNNPEVIAPLDKLRGMIADVAGGTSQGGTLSARIKGNDLVFLLERAERVVNRNR